MTRKQALKKALSEGKQGTSIVIANDYMHKTEVITWDAIDNEYKSNFIDMNYDSNLVNLKAPFIKIVSWDVY